MSPGHTLRQFGRNIGLDHNPLRRTSDRVEAWITLLLVTVFVLGLPCAAWRAGRAAYVGGVHAERAQRADRFPVEATVLADPSIGASTDTTVPSDVAVPSRASGVAAARVPASAHWVGVDGAEHRGTVMVDPRTQAGTRVPVWTDRRGTITDPPQERARTIMDAVALAVLTGVGIGVALVLLRLLAGRALDARRLARWEEAWWQFEPRWSGRS